MANPILSDSTRPVTGGVDTHKDVHVAAVIDRLGAELGTKSFPTTLVGYGDLISWLRTFGSVSRVGVEGTGSWGAELARHLRLGGVEVVEVNRPNRQTRRRTGKSDPLDAVAAARAALSGVHAGIPKSANGPVESLRMLRAARSSAVKGRTQTMNQIRAILDTAPSEVRDRYRHLTPARLIKAITRTRPNIGRAGEPAIAAAITLRALGRRWLFLTTQIVDLTNQLDTIVAATAPNLINVNCVGADTAAALLIAAGDNPERLSSEAGFAALCGVNPMPASSGRTQRHRLNRSGNRDANNALWRIVISRMAHEQRTRDYVERRTTQGLSKREIIRCLKRYVARELYPIITNDLAAT
jgi:transposase